MIFSTKPEEPKKFYITVSFMGEKENFIMNQQDTNDFYRDYMIFGTFDWIRVEEFIDFI